MLIYSLKSDERHQRSTENHNIHKDGPNTHTKRDKETK